MYTGTPSRSESSAARLMALLTCSAVGSAPTSIRGADSEARRDSAHVALILIGVWMYPVSHARSWFTKLSRVSTLATPFGHFDAVATVHPVGRSCGGDRRSCVSVWGAGGVGGRLRPRGLAAVGATAMLRPT